MVQPRIRDTGTADVDVSESSIGTAIAIWAMCSAVSGSGLYPNLQGSWKSPALFRAREDLGLPLHRHLGLPS